MTDGTERGVKVSIWGYYVVFLRRTSVLFPPFSDMMHNEVFGFHRAYVVGFLRGSAGPYHI